MSLLIPKWLTDECYPEYGSGYIVVYEDTHFPIQYSYDTYKVYWNYSVSNTTLTSNGVITSSTDPRLCGKFNTVYEARIEALDYLARDNYPGAALVKVAMEMDELT